MLTEEMPYSFTCNCSLGTQIFSKYQRECASYLDDMAIETLSC